MTTIARSVLFTFLLLGAVIQICLAYVTSEGCGETKQCFQMPYDCTNRSDCEAIVSWRPSEYGNSTIFELLGDMRGKGGGPEEYMAIGFSHDQLMDDTDVWACAAETDTIFHLDHSYNVDNHRNEQGDLVGVVGIELAITDDKIECTFERANSIEGTGSDRFFDLDADAYYLMVARGRLDRTNTKIAKHFTTPLISPEKINFTKTEFTYMPSPGPTSESPQTSPWQSTTLAPTVGDGAATISDGPWFRVLMMALALVISIVPRL